MALNYTIEKYQDNMLDEVVYIWNNTVVLESLMAEMNKSQFESKVMKNKFYDSDGSYVALVDGKVVGFGNAIYNNGEQAPDKTPGYISCVFVDKKYQRRGIGSAILKKLESFLKEKGKTYIRNFFACPINFKWYVPGYFQHEHAGAPAVAINSSYYFLLMANGYNINGQQDAYHIDLTKYEMDEAVKKRIEKNAVDGYTVTIYDESKHYGFDELFDALKSEGWRNAIKYNLARENPNPIVIVQKDGEILGFTGPIYTEESGRASLAGVGIHPKAQGRGLGKTMFCTLCEKSKENGGKFMTLFTGSDNLARNIYLYAGLRIVQSFAIMRKELK